jgi:hypothetical protein
VTFGCKRLTSRKIERGKVGKLEAKKVGSLEEEK